MSDTFDTGFLDFEQGSAGPRVGFLEGLSTGFNQSFRVDSELSLQQEVLNRWNENLAVLEQRTQQRFDPLTVEQMRYYIENRAGNDEAPLISFGDNGSLFRSRAENVAAQTALPDATVAAINKQSEQFAALGLSTFDEVFAEVVELQKKVEGEAASVSERAGAAAFAGQLVGGIAGSFTTRDPQLLASMLVPTGVGRSVALRIAQEAAVAGAAEASLQYGAVARNRELAGLEARDPLQSILLAAGGAAVLRGAFEGGAAGFRALRSRAEPDITLDLEDAQLRQFLGEQPNTPSVRAALDALDDELAMEAASPYGTSYQGLRRFNAEVVEAEMALLGRSDTAVARTLPDLPFGYVEKAADYQIVRETDPELFGRYETAQARVVEAQRVIDEAEATFPRFEDAVDSIDPDTGALVRGMMEELQTPALPAARRADIERQLNIIVESIDEGRILDRLNDISIGPKKQMQAARKALKAANKEYKAATRAVEQRRKTLQMVAQAVKKEGVQETTDLLGYAIATRPVQGSRLATERVVQQRAAIAKDAAEAPDRAIAEMFEDGTIDVGLPVRLPSDFMVPDEAGNFIPLSTVVKDFDEDARLVEAMGSCAL